MSYTDSSTPKICAIPNMIYMDYAATTPCDPRVFEKMEPYFFQFFGNAHSKNHAYGWASDEAVDIARMHIADFLNIDEREIIFTSGATEANTLSLRGMMYQHQQQRNPFRTHLITTQVEHASILSCCHQLEEEGFEVTYLPVNEGGIVDLNELSEAITNKTMLVSIGAVNNETGVIQPMKEVGDICFERGVVLHSDLTQAIGRIEVDFRLWNLGLASFSAHKIYGPKGIGALFVRRKPFVRFRSIMPGGGQERGIRGGTLPVPLCVGFGEACRILHEESPAELPRITELSNRLTTQVLSSVVFSQLNGDPMHKVPHIINIAFPYVEGESLVMGLENICISTGSACSSARLEPSHVLRAMHVNELSVQSSLRFSLGRYSTQEEVDILIPKLEESVNRLRELSPLWDMYQEGMDFSTIRWS